MVSKSNFTPRIVIIEGKDKGKVIELENGTAVIGRSKGDVIVHDSRVSRSHVAIQFDSKSGKLSFTDLKSLNGTLVNGETKEQGALADGDKLQIGNTVFDCQISPPEQVTQAKFHPTESGIRPSTDSGFRPEPFLESEKSGETPLPKVPPEPVGHEPTLRKAESGVPSSRKWYLRLSPRLRFASLAVVGLIFSFIYLSMDQKGGGLVGLADREVTSIKRLGSEGRYAEAVEKAEEFIKKQPDRGEVYLILGELYSRQGKFESSLNSYRRVIDLDKNNGVGHVRLCRLYLLAGRGNEAELEQREIDRIIVEGPQTREFFLELANLYLDFRNLDVPAKKMVVIGQALQNKFAPGETAGMKLEALGLIADNQPGGAFALLEKARTLDQGDAGILQLFVLAKVRAKDPMGALNIAQQWSQTFPDDTRPLLYMAVWKYESKEYADSLTLLQKIEVIGSKSTDDPSLGSAFNLMGRIFADQNRPNEALNAFRRSCDLGFQPGCQAQTAAATPTDAPPASASNTPSNGAALPPPQVQVPPPSAPAPPPTKNLR